MPSSKLRQRLRRALLLLVAVVGCLFGPVLLLTNGFASGSIQVPVGLFGQLASREIGSFIIGVGLFSVVMYRQASEAVQVSYLRALAVVLLCLAGVHVVDLRQAQAVFPADYNWGETGALIFLALWALVATGLPGATSSQAAPVTSQAGVS